MDTPDPLDRLTILERAQFLHDATLRRHGEMLDRHDDHLAALQRLSDQQLALNDQLKEITARLTQEQSLYAERLARHEASLRFHEEIMASLAQTLQAIKDMLDRGNGH
jgi:hypothetical protein